MISRLGRLFTEAGLDGAAVVTSGAGTYQLDLPADSRVDLEDLAAAVVEAEDAAARGENDRALAAAALLEDPDARRKVGEHWAELTRPETTVVQAGLLLGIEPEPEQPNRC